MNLLIGENIRRLRRQRDLTQEEVAAHLGISFQAISKWERADGYPDITMLPSLANYFGVRVDELIGMDEIAKSEKYDEINRLWTENNVKGLHRDNVILMRNSLKTFPNNALLLVQLSTSLEKLDGTEEEKARKDMMLRRKHWCPLHGQYHIICQFWRKRKASPLILKRRNKFSIFFLTVRKMIPSDPSGKTLI